jgi:hypothetical protein
MAAQFLVVRQPGADVPGVGFVKAGQFFTAPAGYVPSRHMRAMNKDAQDELRKLKGQLEKQDAERAAELKDRRDTDGKPVKAPKLAAEVNLDLWEPEVETPVVEDAGLTLQQLGDLAAGTGKASAAIAAASTAAAGSPAKGSDGKRAADR